MQHKIMTLCWHQWRFGLGQGRLLCYYCVTATIWRQIIIWSHNIHLESRVRWFSLLTSDWIRIKKWHLIDSNVSFLILLLELMVNRQTGQPKECHCCVKVVLKLCFSVVVFFFVLYFFFWLAEFQNICALH